MMMNQAGKSMEQLVAWAVMTPRMRKTGRQEANLIGTHNLWLDDDDCFYYFQK